MKRESLESILKQLRMKIENHDLDFNDYSPIDAEKNWLVKY